MAKVAPLEHTESDTHNPRCSRVVPRNDGAGAAETVDREAGAHAAGHQPRWNIRHSWYNSALASKAQGIFRGRVFNAVTMICLFIALFFGDLWQILQVPTSVELDVLLTIIFAVFAMEFIVLSLTDTGYLLGFFFWTDLLGTASMLFDISFLAGEDATQPISITRKSGSSSGEIVLVRAARASRLGARAGRISRVLKILRYTSLIFNNGEEEDKQVKMAHVISNQIANALSTRVAFLTIAVVVIIPLLGMLSYPEVDDSMAAWTEMLQQNALAFREAWAEQNLTRVESARATFVSQVQHFSDFYSGLSYGPFKMVYGETVGDTFVPQTDLLDIRGPWTFSEPRRQSSIFIFNQDMLQVFFNLSAPKRQEAGAAMGLICFTILVMCCFALVMSSSITAIALKPLERMLSVVRERCAEIFKYTDDLADADADKVEADVGHTAEQSSEFMLLEKVVGKLAAIVHLSTNQDPEVREEMNDDEIMMLNWMQGAPVPSTGYRGTLFVASRATQGTVLATTSTLTPSLIAELETDSFCCIDMPKENRIAVAQYLVTSPEGCSGFVSSHVKEQTLLTFINTVESKYHANPFHNFAHAVDVQYTVYRYMSLIEADAFLSDSTIFWLLIAAIAHDVGHLGVNNQYLVETSHDLALRYNDRSPLENLHCSKLFHILSDPEANVFAEIEKSEFKDIRRGIIQAILHTDVVKHNEMNKELSLLYQMHSNAFDNDKEQGLEVLGEHSQMIANALLHAADIGNPMKPWELCCKIAHLILDEFAAQGDKEKELGIPVSMLNDREKVNRPNSQIVMAEFMMAPMVEAVVNIFPQLDLLATHLGKNIKKWELTWVQESDPPEDAVEKIRARVYKIVNKCEALCRHANNCD
mmetsp:Transcript_62891/g.183922  ORF Transcript_62891/g.183922 Transcript_62891/m.183922 type:complete len:872 (+) Transcript_62891:217-2832(+)